MFHDQIEVFRHIIFNEDGQVNESKFLSLINNDFHEFQEVCYEVVNNIDVTSVDYIENSIDSHFIILPN